MMGWRERLADWISGGALRKAREDVEFWKRMYSAKKRRDL